MAMAEFSKDRHVLYFLDILEQLPSAYEAQDTNRLTLAYFAVSALDILDALPQVPAKDVIDWVYSLQVLPLTGDDLQSSTINKESRFGFRGSPSIGLRFSTNGAIPVMYDGSHLASTYSALAILRILGDDFSCIEQEAVLKTMRTLQQPDGRCYAVFEQHVLHLKSVEHLYDNKLRAVVRGMASFCPVYLGAERDLRFTYCAVKEIDNSAYGVGGVDEKAAAICAFLNDWSGMDVEKAVAYALSCQSYDEGYGLSPGLEPQGGGTYCAVATSKLLGQLMIRPKNCTEPGGSILDRDDLVGWCLRRQTDSGGFQGRANKAADTCYAFWVGSSLKMLECYDLCNKGPLRSFLLTCQTKYGGFGKFPRDFPDLLHSFYGICAFSLLDECGLNSLCCELGITMRAAEGLPILAQI